MNKKRILLVHPEISHSKYNFDGIIENEPLELEYIQAVLKDDFDCTIFDVQRETINLRQKLEQFLPDVVYICGRIKQENFIKNHINTIKDFREQTVVILGGIHVQKNYDLFFLSRADYILTTFDIFKLKNIINHDDLTNESGICYRKEDKWIVNSAEPFDINNLPHPDRSYFYSHLDHYRYLDIKPCAQVRTAYCCAFKCKFCYRNLTNCGKYVCRDIDDVVDEIEEINCDNIYFIDDDFLLDCQRIQRFIRLIKERNIHKKYICFARADFIVKNKELVKELVEIGFCYFLVGLEAISNRQLNDYNKGTSVDINVDCVNYLNSIGTNTMGMFIVDTDFEKEDFKNIYRWVKQNHLRHVAIFIFTPIRPTAVYQEYKDRLITHNPEDFDYLHVTFKPTKCSVKKYYLYYYLLLIQLFLLAKKQGVYDFLDYGSYIKVFIKSILKGRPDDADQKYIQ